MYIHCCPFVVSCKLENLFYLQHVNFYFNVKETITIGLLSKRNCLSFNYEDKNMGYDLSSISESELSKLHISQALKINSARFCSNLLLKRNCLSPLDYKIQIFS